MKDTDGKQLLDAEGRPLTDRPGIVFFAKCVNAIKTIPQLVRSERDPEDIDERSNDDAVDGIRYSLQFRRGRTRTVEIWLAICGMHLPHFQLTHRSIELSN